MPLGGANINWNEASPADSDLVGQGDDEMRSIRTAVRNALDSEHNFPSTGGAGTGYHRHGSARPYFGTISTVSSDGTDSHLFLTSDTSELYSVTSLSAFPVGGLFSLLAANANGVYMPGSNSKLAVQFSQGSTNGTSGITTITYAGSGFSGRPLTFIQVSQGGVVPLTDVGAPLVLNQSRTTFSLRVPTVSTDSALLVTFNWFSIGTVASGVA